MTSAGRDIIAGLDLGTTKVCVVVGERSDEGIDVIGIGTVPSKGLRKGVVVNIEATVQAIRGAIEQAENMAGVQIGTVFAGIGGSHVRGMNQQGVAAIASREVCADDVERVLEQAKAFPLPADRQVIHVLPQEYVVDDQDGIKEPIGMSGVRLQARVHVVTAAVPPIQNIIKCAERCQLHVAEVVLQPLASAYAVLSDDEREIGVALVDVGGGTSDVIVYVNGAVVHTSVVPIGGLNFTNDVATGLRTPVAEAERIKVRFGCASTRMVEPDERIEVPSVGGRPPRQLPRQVLSEIIQPRAEELLGAVGHVLSETGFAEMLGAGVVLTGGTTLLEGTEQLAEEVLGMPVRRGLPSGVGGLVDVVRSPAYATAVGLVKYGAERLAARAAASEPPPVHTEIRPRLGTRLGRWLRDVF
ncbi:MAG: cell division protein FtsA [Myxococcales bacterium]|nr:cell division protein FtsA [Myxococcales bacterium]